MSRVVATVRGGSKTKGRRASARAVIALTAKVAQASGLVESGLVKSGLVKSGLVKTPRARMLPKDPLESAKAAHLRHVDDSVPGIARKRTGKGFTYVKPDGATVKDAATLRRIKSLVIPPAWTNVWICASENGHIQATGRDARGRKQYRYHPRFREIRDETKYERMLAFADALPRIRERVDKDLSASGLTREKVLATVVRLLELTLIRVGNEEYARENASFGLTTLRTRHVDVAGSNVKFHFRGKSGVEHAVEVHDRRVAKVVARCTDLPGQILFQYVDDAGDRCSVESADVNAYLRDITGAEFTAKDFRTWAGTVLAAAALAKLEAASEVAAAAASPSATALKKNLVAAIKNVAARLGNTAAVCKRCYVHPEILGAYLSKELAIEEAPPTLRGVPAEKAELSAWETAVLGLLRARLARRSKELRAA